MTYKNNYLQTNLSHRQTNLKNTLNTYMQSCLNRKCSLCFEESTYFELRLALENSPANESKETHFSCKECGEKLNKKINGFYCMIHLKEHKCSDVKIIRKGLY
jgi:hypothetical protein